MDADKQAVDQLALRLPTFGALMAGITQLQCKIGSGMRAALLDGKPIQRDPHKTGPQDKLWSAEVAPTSDYRRLVLAVTCNDKTLMAMLKAALVDEYVYLDPQDIMHDSEVMFYCTISNPSGNLAAQYQAMLAGTDPS